MAKVAIKSEKLTPFGGIFSIMEQFDSKNNITSKIRERAISYVYDIDVYMKSLILFSQTPQPTPK